MKRPANGRPLNDNEWYLGHLHKPTLNVFVCMCHNPCNKPPKTQDIIERELDRISTPTEDDFLELLESEKARSKLAQIDLPPI